MKQIPLTQGKFALVDDSDFEHLNQWKWHYNGSYAVRWNTLNNRGVYMHRDIMNTPKNMQTDHMNRDRLDNQRSNLRIATLAQNRRNRLGTAKSGYKGVWYDASTTLAKPWRSQIQINKKIIALGRFESAKEASTAYIKAAKIHHGEFAGGF